MLKSAHLIVLYHKYKITLTLTILGILCLHCMTSQPRGQKLTHQDMDILLQLYLLLPFQKPDIPL